MMENKYELVEVFYSLQGEGFRSGTANIFVRFSHCNLSCSFCDTPYTEVNLTLSESELIKKIKTYPSKNIIFTGGEPTLALKESLVRKLKKEGYYKSSSGIGIKSVNRLLNRWDPYPANLTITLREKKNPVPMYAKKTGPIAVPVIGKPVGYDLEKGDWVKPHGKGEISDLVFTANIKEDDHGNKYQSYTLTFSNKLDGIQEYKDKKYIQSYFKWPYEAPLTNYNPSNYELIVYGINKFPVRKKCKLKENTNYIFRTRTKVDKNGEIISANYGKILNGFDFGGKNFTISFTYYFNPDPKSMSLEFDPAKNLFKFSEKEWEHEVKAP